MKNWITNLFKKEKPIINDEVEEKEFEFLVMETCHIGDKYVYMVKAKTEKEAFKLLVDDFFGENVHSDKIKSENFQVVYPNDARFIYRGMPRWFAKRITGNRRDEGVNYQHKLEEYCIKNNIILKNDN